jgi:thiol-disulfide isomerase/thioredoxin
MAAGYTGLLLVALFFAVATIAGADIPWWVVFLVFVLVRVLPGILGVFGRSALVGKPAAPLDDSVVMLQGERPRPGSAGMVVVVERWATWCPPCVASIPHLNEVYAQHRDREDFQIVGVTDESDSAKVRAFMSEHGMTYPVAQDTKGLVGAHYPSMGIPNATIVGRDGRVFWQGHPMQMDAPLKQALDGAVAPELKK